MKSAEIEGGAIIWARQTIESEIFYSKPHSWFKIWFYLVSRANHKSTKRFERGGCFLQYGAVCDATGVTIDELKKCMGWLRRTGSVVTKRSTRGVNVFLPQYSYFQNLDNYLYHTKTLDMHEISTEESLETHSDKQECNNSKKEIIKENIFMPNFIVGECEEDEGVGAGGASKESETSTGSRVNKAIALFEKVIPGDFIGKKTAYMKRPTREAVGAYMGSHSIEELREVVRRYEEGKSDMYRPTAGTVYEFFTFKLAKIEGYVEKYKNNGLYAHKSISSPEQRTSSDQLIQQKMDAALERQSQNKEKWELTHKKQ